MVCTKLVEATFLDRQTGDDEFTTVQSTFRIFFFLFRERGVITKYLSCAKLYDQNSKTNVIFNKMSSKSLIYKTGKPSWKEHKRG